MRGRVTILPLANAPAEMAARRCSPLDGGNLNRAFRGEPNGAPPHMKDHLARSADGIDASTPHFPGKAFPR
jgi:predicted deacylase